MTPIKAIRVGLGVKKASKKVYLFERVYIITIFDLPVAKYLSSPPSIEVLHCCVY